MKILAIDSSGTVASVAIVEDDITLAEYSVNYKKTHSQTLLLMIDELCGQIQLEYSSIDAVAIASGPGSFTGLRIGSATAKGLAYAWNKPIVEVSTLEGLAYNITGGNCLVCPIMDARRSQTYTAVYRRNQGQLLELISARATSIYELLDELEILDGDIYFVGDGIPVFYEVINHRLGDRAILTTANNNRQRASSIGIVAMNKLVEGRVVLACDHVPIYLRLSQAEREKLGARDGRSSN